MLTKEQLREAGLMKAEVTPTGICVVTDNGTEVFLSNEMMKRFGEAMERRGKEEYEIVVQPSAINRREIVVSTIWAADLATAKHEAEEDLAGSSMRDLDYVVRLKSK